MTLISPEDKIFVAGHRGLAGSAICRALLRSGYSRQLTANRSQLDLLDANAVHQWFSHHQPDVVILAAAKVGGIEANLSYPADFLLENIKIQTNVIESAWHTNVRRFLFLGSSCIYPKYCEQPIRESSLLTSSLEPTNDSYAIAKISGLKLCESLRKQYGFDAISLMPTNLYGPGDNYHPTNSHVIAALINRFYEATQLGIDYVSCWGTGLPRREFLHADDLGNASVYALEHWQPTMNELSYINIGSGVDYTIKYLAELIADLFDYKGQIRWDTAKPDGTPQKLLDIQRMSELGWNAEIPLEKGLFHTIAQYKKVCAFRASDSSEL